MLGFKKTARFISAFGEGNFLKDRRIESKSGEKEFYFLGGRRELTSLREEGFQGERSHIGVCLDEL